MLEKITPEELAGVGVIGLPDTPRLSTEEMQRKFEETAREVIIPKFNALVDELSADDAAGKVNAVGTNPQELTEEQRETARENISALTWEAETLDDAKKKQARTNIGAIGAAEIGELGGVVSYAAQQSLTSGQQAQARENIGAAAQADLEAAQEDIEEVAGNVGTTWQDISSQYAATIDNSSLEITGISVHRRGIVHHLRIDLKATAKIDVGAKVTITFTKGQYPAFDMRVATGSYDTAAIGRLDPHGDLTFRIVAADMPSTRTMYFAFEFTV
jgi:hypothetical protein